MGMHIGFSSSTYDSQSRRFKQFANPNPNNYKIEECWEQSVELDDGTQGNLLVINIHYPDCTNYEGRKILVYKNTTLLELVNQKTIDPHFSDNKEFYSPIARFLPTNEGWEMAKIFCTLVSTNH
jgi:hypothetical protein